MLCACCSCTQHEDDRDIQREQSKSAAATTSVPPSSSGIMNRNNKIVAGSDMDISEIKSAKKSSKTKKSQQEEEDWYAQFKDKEEAEEDKKAMSIVTAADIKFNNIDPERDAYYRNACHVSEAKDTSFTGDELEPTGWTRSKHRDVWGYCYDYSQAITGGDLEYCLLCAKSEFMKSGRYGNSDVNFRSVELPSATVLLIAGTCSFCQTRIIPYWTCCLKPFNTQQECSLPSYDF